MKQTASIIGLFLIITLVMTYPLALRLGSSLRDMGDPLLNAWILSWDIDQIVHLNTSGFFDANIFYPQKKTLAYSEFLIPQALAVLPVKLLSGNPVLAHNFAVLLAFLTTGLGMFFLARYLTRNSLAAATAGLIFAFSPFMFGHLYQVQVLTAGGIPLAFLFLHKFFVSDRLKDILLFGLFFSLQSLANGYYALYLMLFAGLFILVMTSVRKKYKDVRFWGRLALCALLILVCIGPFFYQYVQVQKEMGFKRDIAAHAGLTSFLATSSINTLYGKVTARFRRIEGELFPGAAAFFLACLGAFYALRLKKPPPESDAAASRARRGARAGIWIVTLAAWFYALILYVVLTRGGLDVRLGKTSLLHAHSALKTGLMLLVLVIVSVATRRLGKVSRLLPFTFDWTSPWIYALILGLAFLFTFGPHGPYVLLYKYVPGFSGIRVASRFQVFVMFGLAVLAAYGMAGLSRRLATVKPRKILLAALPVLILAEYLSVPVPLTSVPVKNEIPEVYRWLARQPGDFAVVEIPLPLSTMISRRECARTYYSAYHRKKLVNGYSGYFPGLYFELLRRYQAMPTSQLVRDMRDMGVRMIIVHTSQMRPGQAKRTLADLDGLGQEVRAVARFGKVHVYEMIAGPSEPLPPIAPSTEGLVPRESWTATASVNAVSASKAFDGSLETRWDTAGIQKKDQWFELDLGRTYTVRGLSLKLAGSSLDYPRAIRVEVTTDGQTWTVVAENDRVIVPIRAFLHPRDITVDIPFPAQEARRVRLVQTGHDTTYYWSIYELKVWSKS
jgi:hypothetical protein